MRHLAEMAFWWAACTGIWLLTLSSVSLSESLVAIGAALPCALLAVAARRAVHGYWPVRPAWARWLLPLPAAVLADTLRVLGLAAGVLVGRRIPPGELRSVDLSPERTTGDRQAHHAVAVLLTTATPGTVVLDVGGRSGRMSFHALGSGRPRMEEVVRG